MPSPCGEGGNEVDGWGVYIACLFKIALLQSYPSSASFHSAPSPEGEGFVFENLNAYYRRGELRSPEIQGNNAARNRRTQFAPTIRLFNMCRKI